MSMFSRDGSAKHHMSLNMITRIMRLDKRRLFCKQDGMQLKKCIPRCYKKSVLYLSASWILIRQKPMLESSVEMATALPVDSIDSSTRSGIYEPLLFTTLSLRRSSQNGRVSSFLGINTIGVAHSVLHGLVMHPASYFINIGNVKLSRSWTYQAWC